MINTDHSTQKDIPMDKKRWMVTMVLAATAVLAMSACSIVVDRNPDGSLKAGLER
jgi:hypothetical protein